MNHLPESLLRDFAKTSMIEDNTTVVKPWDIEDPWISKLPRYEEVYLLSNSEADMPIQEFNNHRLNSKRLGGIKRFDIPQDFVLKTSYERQLKTDRILLNILHLKRNLNLSEETCAELQKEKKVAANKIPSSLGETNNEFIALENEELQRRAQPSSSAIVGC